MPEETGAVQPPLGTAGSAGPAAPVPRPTAPGPDAPATQRHDATGAASGPASAAGPAEAAAAPPGAHAAPAGTPGAAQPFDPWAPPGPGTATAWPTTPVGSGPQSLPPGPPWPYGGPAGWPQLAPPPGVNGFAVASLVLGFTCLVPLSAGFGITALGQIRRTGQRGRGLARTGLVLSAVWALAWITLIVAAVVSHPGLPSADGLPPGTTSVFSVRTGDCFEAPLHDRVRYVTVLPCGEPHEEEAFGQARIDGTSGFYPGAQSAQDQSEQGCRDLVDRYIMDSWAHPATLQMYYYYPSATQWAKDPHALCVFVDSKGKRTGSVRRDYTDLNGAQLDYLDCTRDHNDALGREPKEDPGQALHAYRVWAAQVADATELEAQQLEAGDWPAQARKPIADLVREIRRSIPYWRQAAAARDVGSERLALARASVHDGYEQARKARAVLGLATGDTVDSGGGGGTSGQAV
ncbi:DUF4190 domain-containing protein [Streptacidiphilus griseoplanus]|uniref:DUF4190 domain-containing protein n=1 Tax=Peterkaempfera griseoplana TaxID=66896 RepID=UPI0006E1598D|nr:DUF4190 domain-containing protein [Peterkaempfera griseoplana]